MTYLVVRFSTLGSVAMLVPVLSAVAEKRPDDFFVVLTQKPLNVFFASLPNVKLHVAESGNNMWRLAGLLIREYSIDTVIDLQDSASSRVLRCCMRLHGRRVVTIRKQRAKRRCLIRRGYKRSEPLLTEFQLYAETFERAGLRTTDTVFHRLKFDNHPLEYQKASGEQWIGVAPFATYRTNMLPYKQTKDLLAYLSRRPRTRVFLFGAGEVECEVLNQWELVFENTVCMAGKLSLEQELAVMQQLDIMVCMDSANQHLSSLVGLDALTIWCGTHPYAGFYGWKQPAGNIIQRELDCRPCTLHGAEKCKKGTFECQMIGVTEIIDKLEQILSKK